MASFESMMNSQMQARMQTGSVQDSKGNKVEVTGKSAKTTSWRYGSFNTPAKPSGKRSNNILHDCVLRGLGIQAEGKTEEDKASQTLVTGSSPRNIKRLVIGLDGVMCYKHIDSSGSKADVSKGVTEITYTKDFKQYRENAYSKTTGKRAYYRPVLDLLRKGGWTDNAAVTGLQEIIILVPSIQDSTSLWGNMYKRYNATLTQNQALYAREVQRLKGMEEPVSIFADWAYTQGFSYIEDNNGKILVHDRVIPTGRGAGTVYSMPIELEISALREHAFGAGNGDKADGYPMLGRVTLIEYSYTNLIGAELMIRQGKTKEEIKSGMTGQMYFAKNSISAFHTLIKSKWSQSGEIDFLADYAREYSTVFKVTDIMTSEGWRGNVPVLVGNKYSWENKTTGILALYFNKLKLDSKVEPIKTEKVEKKEETKPKHDFTGKDVECVRTIAEVLNHYKRLKDVLQIPTEKLRKLHITQAEFRGMQKELSIDMEIAKVVDNCFTSTGVYTKGDEVLTHETLLKVREELIGCAFRKAMDKYKSMQGKYDMYLKYALKDSGVPDETWRLDKQAQYVFFLIDRLYNLGDAGLRTSSEWEVR